jgi:hypothetical protein
MRRSITVIIVGIVESVFRAEEEARNSKDDGEYDHYRFEIHSRFVFPSPRAILMIKLVSREVGRRS